MKSRLHIEYKGRTYKSKVHNKTTKELCHHYDLFNFNNSAISLNLEMDDDIILSLGKNAINEAIFLFKKEE